MYLSFFFLLGVRARSAETLLYLLGFLLGVRARSAETLLYLLGFLLLLLLLFCPETNRAAQTVRARKLKLGQMVELNLGRTYQSLSPIGP